MSDSAPQDDRLAEYQTAVLDTLHDGTDGATMAAEIDAAARAAGLAVGELDAVLVEVAADLTRSWGRLVE